MNKIRLYLWINNLKRSVHFLSETTNLFKVESFDDEMGECILSFQDNDTIKLSIRESHPKAMSDQGQPEPNYSFALEVTNCRAVYDNVKNQPADYDWKISHEFFGEYLATPIGDQFAIIEKNGSKILIFDKTTSE